MSIIRKLILKRRIKKAWLKRMEEYHDIKASVFAASAGTSPNKVADLRNATEWAEYWMVQHHGVHWREKTIMR